MPRSKGNEMWLVNCHIPGYLPGGFRNHEPFRRRKLLLNRREIGKLQAQTAAKGHDHRPDQDLFPGRHRQMRTCGGEEAKNSTTAANPKNRKEAKREANEAMYSLTPALIHR